MTGDRRQIVAFQRELYSARRITGQLAQHFKPARFRLIQRHRMEAVMASLGGFNMNIAHQRSQLAGGQFRRFPDPQPVAL